MHAETNQYMNLIVSTHHTTERETKDDEVVLRGEGEALRAI
jgi:hypothetical protein